MEARWGVAHHASTFAPQKMGPPFRKLGIIREGKPPADRRAPLTPDLCAELVRRYPQADLVVQRSTVRVFADAEYEALGIRLVDDLSDRDLILGVKEVPIDQLVPGKAHLFFSHTIKRQAHNRLMMQAILERGITLIDHELLTDRHGRRVLAFGHWAGVVGAYNAFRAWQMNTGEPALKPAHQCRDQAELARRLADIALPGDLRIVITGGGRVGTGAMEVLDGRSITRVEPHDFLRKDLSHPVYTVLGSADLYGRVDGKPFDKAAFHADPFGHYSLFHPYACRAQLYMACHFWDPRGPKILSREELKHPDLALRVIADISCDVGGPIDSTLRSTTIADPFYGYDRATHREVPAGAPGSIAVMAVDNLPCELPRDASASFGRVLLDRVIPALLGQDDEGLIARATIVSDGRLTRPFAHLADYAGVADRSSAP